LFGYYGLFRTSRLGRSTWYVTNRGKAVVVVTGEKTALFSPDDVEGFLTAIGAPTPAPVSAAQDGGSRFGALMGAAVGIAAMVVAAAAMLYSPGPPSYTLTPESLAIHDRLYPVTLSRTGVDVEHIRVIDLGVDTEWHPTERTDGFGNPHYASGWFRVASGKTVRMYRAGSTRLVLLPPKGDGDAVLLETREPEKFVVEVREKWSGPS
jgi:hypothetical protein